MLNRLILKVTKFQLPPPKRFGTVVKNILGGHHAPDWTPIKNMQRVASFQDIRRKSFAMAYYIAPIFVTTSYRGTSSEKIVQCDISFMRLGYAVTS